MSDERIRVRVLYAGKGGYHSEVVSVPGCGVEEHDRLIDLIREDPGVAAECYIDAARLCSAQIVEDEVDGEEG